MKRRHFLMRAAIFYGTYTHHSGAAENRMIAGDGVVWAENPAPHFF